MTTDQMEPTRRSMYVRVITYSMRRRRLNKRKFEKYQTDKRTVGVGNIPTLPLDEYTDRNEEKTKKTKKVGSQ